jgi:hypothetical protein
MEWVVQLNCAPDPRINKMPWKSLLSTVTIPQPFCLDLVKQFLKSDCRRWIQQERAKLMQNLMRNDEKCQKKIGENLEGKLVRSENVKCDYQFSVTINTLYQLLIHLLITISKIKMN